MRNDTERLDAVVERLSVEERDGAWEVTDFFSGERFSADTPRNAIDAAIKAQRVKHGK